MSMSLVYQDEGKLLGDSKVVVQSTDGYSFPTTPVDHYRRIYYEVIDLITTCINNRFDQPGYRIYCNIQNLLLKAANGDDYNAELKFVTDFYGSILMVIC